MQALLGIALAYFTLAGVYVHLRGAYRGIARGVRAFDARCERAWQSALAAWRRWVWDRERRRVRRREGRERLALEVQHALVHELAAAREEIRELRSQAPHARVSRTVPIERVN